jgi:hypothetical protein
MNRPVDAAPAAVDRLFLFRGIAFWKSPSLAGFLVVAAATDAWLPLIRQ